MKIARPWNKRVRPEWLGDVNFLPVCSVCKKPITDEPCCEDKKEN